MGRERGLLLAILRAVVRDGEAQAGRRAGGVLVAEHLRLLPSARVLAAAAGLRLHLRVRVYVDPLHPEPCDPLSPRGSAPRLPGMRKALGAPGEVLLGVRRAP